MAKSVISLLLKENPFSGDGTSRTHNYLLRVTSDGADDWDDSEIFDWLRNPQAINGSGQPVVERPDFTTPPGTLYPIVESWDDRVLKDIKYSVKKDSDPQIYEVTAEYTWASGTGGAAVVDPQQGQTGVGAVEFSFQFAPERVLYRSSLETMAIIAPDSAVFPLGAKNHYGAINVDEDGTIQGDYAPDPASQFNIRFTETPGWWTQSRITTILRRRGHVNSKHFTIYGTQFDPGEVRFLGANGTISNSIDSSVDFSFGIRENKIGDNGLSLDGLVTSRPDNKFDKVGWHLFWAYFVSQVNTTTNQAELRLAGGYVERLFEESDLNDLFK